MPTHKFQIEVTTEIEDPSDAAEAIGMTLLDYGSMDAVVVNAEDGTQLFADGDNDDEDESGDEDE